LSITKTILLKLGEVLERNNKTQIRIAEQKKYLTLLSFSGRWNPFRGEKEYYAILKGGDYDFGRNECLWINRPFRLQIRKEIDFVCLNFANDMRGIYWNDDGYGDHFAELWINVSESVQRQSPMNYTVRSTDRKLRNHDQSWRVRPLPHHDPVPLPVGKRTLKKKKSCDGVGGPAPTILAYLWVWKNQQSWHSILYKLLL
jgi:hypothetical protein